MEALTYKCPGCGAGLTFDIKTKLLVCDNCCEMYSPAALGMPEETNEEQVLNQPNELAQDKSVAANTDYEVSNQDEYMDINLYHCSSCGAEIMTSDVEISTFCSYCGQATIMFDRVSKEKKPEKIIPFVLTKEQALRKAKAKFNGAKYLTDSINDITVESVYGIYMPYWAYDAQMDMMAEINKKQNNVASTTEYKNNISQTVLLDASKRFSDYASERLNPFSMRDAEDFDIAYLSGFYADRSDVNAEDRTADVKEHMEKVLTDMIYDGYSGIPREMRETYKSLYEKAGVFKVDVLQENFHISDKKYVLCPVYFITFKIGYELVILLVNGCNGKVVGSIPIDQRKFEKQQKQDTVICGIIFCILSALFFRYMPALWSAGVYFMLAFFLVMSGKKAKKKYERMYYETNTNDMFNLSQDREK